jgi:hypothetical protein
MEGKSVAGICIGILEVLAYFVKQALWDTPMDLLSFFFLSLNPWIATQRGVNGVRGLRVG